jgi:tight adherence protein C
MTGFLMAAGVLLVGAAAWLLVRAYVLPRVRFETHLRDVESYGFGESASDREGNAARSSLNATLNAFAERLGRGLIDHVPRLKPLRRGQLTAAGYYEATPDAVHGYRAMAALLLAALVVLYSAASGAFSFLGLVVTAIAAVAGWELPAVLIRHRGDSRLNKIDHDLPQFIDLLVATIEAGSAFGGALSGVAGRFQGPLGEELSLTMRQQSLGMATELALTDMAERVETPSVRAFVRTIIRAESHGASIGPVLRHLASDIRQRRRDAAREKIQKAPIKMLFPLAFLILPALLLVILFPAMYNILHVLSHA